MAENLFNPKSRKEDERQITRVQKSFEDGVFGDIPASDVPENGLVELKDMINFGSYLESRPGSKAWGSLPNSNAHNSWKFHEGSKRLFLHIGGSIYFTDVVDKSIGTWTLLYKTGIDDVTSYKSHMIVYKDDVLLYCGSGIFKIKASLKTPTYYKINNEVPTELVTSAGTGDYKYRYVYSASKLTGNGVRNRQTFGTFVDIETGTTEFNITNNRDYGEILTSATISSGNLVTTSGYTVPTDKITDNTKEQYTHLSIYRTKDIGTGGVHPQTNAPNEIDLYVWDNDIAINNAYFVSSSGTTVTATRGTFSQFDIGSPLWVHNGSGNVSGLITAHISSTVVTTDTTFSVSGNAAALGNATFFTGSQNGTTLTSAISGIFVSGDVGKMISLSNGTSRLITGYTSATVVEVDITDVSTGLDGAFGCTERNFTDTINDTVMLDRERDYSLKQRFWTNILNCDDGEIFAGHMFCIQRNKPGFYYSQLAEDSLMGQYNAAYQTETFNDNVKHISVFPNFLVVYCANSIYTIPTTYFTEREITSVGEVVSIVTGTNLVTNDTGLLDFGSLQSIGSGMEMFVASDYSLRIFDGNEITGSLSEKRIESELRKMQAAFSSSYTKSEGYNLWGKQ